MGTPKSKATFVMPRKTGLKTRPMKVTLSVTVDVEQFSDLMEARDAMSDQRILDIVNLDKAQSQKREMTHRLRAMFEQEAGR